MQDTSIKILSSTRSGSSTWLSQRFTALFLIFLFCWLIYFIFEISYSDSFISIVKKPVNVITLIIFTIVALYHGSFGMRVVIEDYISSSLTRTLLIFFTWSISIVTCISFIVALLHLINLV